MVDFTRESPATTLFARGATPLLRSLETAATAGSALASPSYAILDDMGSVDPTTWTLNTVAGSGGKQLTDAINSLPDKSMFWLPEFLQGETGYPTAGAISSTYNSQVTGSPYIGELGEDQAWRAMQGMTQLVSQLRTVSGNPNLVMAVDLVNSNDLAKITQLFWCELNPTLGFISSGNPFHTKVPDTSVAANTDHYSVQSNFDNEMLVCTRARAWWRAQNNRKPTGAYVGPSYGQFPKITGIVAAAGSNTIDLTVSLPNGGALVVPTTPTKGWEVYTGTTSTAIGASGKTYETGGTPLTVSSVGLKPGTTDTIRLTLSANLTAGKKTVFYGRITGSGLSSGGGFRGMWTDDAATSAAAEPLLESCFRANMPLLICPQGITITV